MLTAILPGVSKDEVSIEVHNNTLMLRGERKPASAVSDERYYRRECASWLLPALVRAAGHSRPESGAGDVP